MGAWFASRFDPLPHCHLRHLARLDFAPGYNRSGRATAYFRFTGGGKSTASTAYLAIAGETSSSGYVLTRLQVTPADDRVIAKPHACAGFSVGMATAAGATIAPSVKIR
jgi:hypothetical protein